MSKAGFAAVLIPIFFAACSQNNVTEDGSLKKYFDAAGVSGTFGLFDNGQGHFTIYNLPRFRDSACLPAGTFDIFQSLVAVQTGLVKDDSALLSPSPQQSVRDALLRTIHEPETNPCGSSVLTLGQAFQYSCDDAFRALARHIGKDTLKKWIDSLGYGNKDMGGTLDSFWLNNRLKVTADEELGLMKRLYFDQLPFFPHTQLVVRRMMLKEGNANYTLSYKTATGINEKGHAIGWILGWIEENKHPYFFVLNLEAPGGEKAPLSGGMRILHFILQQQGFFLGKK